MNYIDQIREAVTSNYKSHPDKGVFNPGDGECGEVIELGDPSAPIRLFNADVLSVPNGETLDNVMVAIDPDRELIIIYETAAHKKLNKA